MVIGFGRGYRSNTLLVGTIAIYVPIDFTILIIEYGFVIGNIS